VKEQVQVEVEVIRKVTVAGKWVFYEHIKKPATPAKPKGEKKERKAGVAYADRHKAGLCVKCNRPAPKEGTVCAYCRAMATYCHECKAEKKPFTRENFARTTAAHEAEKAAAKGEQVAKVAREAPGVQHLALHGTLSTGGNGL